MVADIAITQGAAPSKVLVYFDRNGFAYTLDRAIGQILPPSHTAPMFTVTEAEAAAIRTAFDQGRRVPFPGVTDNAKARECARTIAARRPLIRQSMRHSQGS
jgi:glucose dehydrogenase